MHIYDNYNGEIFGSIHVVTYIVTFLCLENEIDGDAFLELTEDMIRTLIPTIGPRAKFLAKHNKLVGTLVIVVCIAMYMNTYVYAKNKCHVVRFILALV